MQEIVDIIRNCIDDPACTFIFPSEITAVFWRKKALSLSHAKALKSDRFISWDVFKERYFSVSESSAPSNMIIRILFSSWLLRENSGDRCFLKNIVHPNYAGNPDRYTGTIARILPTLEKIEAEMTAGRIIIESSLRADLEILRIRYKEFLDSNNLFEPAYRTAPFKTPQGNFILFFSSVLEDYREFAPKLEGHNVRIVNVDGPNTIGIRQFANTHREIDWVFLSIGELLSLGVNHTDIVITPADTAGLDEEIREKSNRFGIPLNFRYGKALTAYPEATFFSKLQACAASGYGIESLKSIFINNLLPWRNESVGRRLVKFGIEHYGLRNYHDGTKPVNRWQSTLDSFANNELKRFYKSFSTHVEAMCSAGDFKTLRETLYAFIAVFFDTAKLSARGLYIFQTCLDVLNDLVREERRMEGTITASPLTLWQTVLKSRIYVPKSDHEGIAVYPYRVSAGMQPLYHFIVGASHNGTIVRLQQYGFLPDYSKSSDLVSELDVTDKFLPLYCVSGGHVQFSYSKESFGGPELPPAYFVARDLVAEQDAESAPNLFEIERSLWNEKNRYGDGGSKPPAAFHPVQKLGFQYIDSTGFTDKANNAAVSDIQDLTVVRQLEKRQTNEQGYFSVSPTAIDRWSRCPFVYLIQDVLGIPEEDYDSSFTDARTTGTLIHAVFSELFSTLNKNPVGFADAVAAHETNILAEIIDRTLLYWERKKPIFLPPAWTEVKRYLETYLPAFMSVEKNEFPDFTIAGIEKTLTFQDKNHGYELIGRIDRISEKDGRYVLVDYKKRNYLTKKDFTADSLGSYQIPCYIILVKEAFGDVHSASYYDVENAKYDHVYSAERPSSWLADEDISRLENITVSAIKTMISNANHGVYKTAESDESCAGCRLRPICRQRYAIR